MSTIALAKPGSVTTAIISCTKLGAANVDFPIKVETATFRYNNLPERTTGDGDVASSWDTGYFADFSFRLNGFMLAQSVVTFPIASLIDSSKNPFGASSATPTTASLSFVAATQQVLQVPRVLITQFDILWGRYRGVVGLVMSGYATDYKPIWSTVVVP